MATPSKEKLMLDIQKLLDTERDDLKVWETTLGREIIRQLETPKTADELADIKDRLRTLVRGFDRGGLKQGNEFRLCRYEFSAEEKAVIATEMADAVSKVASKTDELKAVKSQIQSDIDLAQATLRQKAEHLRSGFEMRSIECEKVFFPKEKLAKWFRLDTMDLVHDRPMRPDELQAKLPGIEPGA